MIYSDSMEGGRKSHECVFLLGTAQKVGSWKEWRYIAI